MSWRGCTTRVYCPVEYCASFSVVPVDSRVHEAGESVCDHSRRSHRPPSAVMVSVSIRVPVTMVLVPHVIVYFCALAWISVGLGGGGGQSRGGQQHGSHQADGQRQEDLEPRAAEN